MDTNNHDSTDSAETSDIADDLPIIDVALQQEFESNQQGMTSDLFAMLIESLQGELKNINQAHQQNDSLLLIDHVHYLHGAACYCGIPRLTKATKNLELALRQDSGAEQIGKLLITLNHETQSVLAYAKQQDAINEG